MPTTDTSEKGLETLIVEYLVNEAGYVQRKSTDYDRDHAVDLAQLQAFINATQSEAAEALELSQDVPKRLQFLNEPRAFIQGNPDLRDPQIEG